MSSPERGRPLRLGACLSLTGRYAMFGTQAARGLRTWAALDGNVELVIEDDRGEPTELMSRLPEVATRCDLLLGPYSTHLMRAANRVISDLDHLLWNHGGSGDDVEAAVPGYVVSVLTPTSRYAEPFLRMLADRPTRAPVWLVSGRGGFARQVLDGAEMIATALGLRTERVGSPVRPPNPTDTEWSLFCAASFADDVDTVRRALALPNPPRIIGAVAAGVHEFGRAVRTPNGIYGIAQWSPGRVETTELGPDEADFLGAYGAHPGSDRPSPDYPAVQAVAAAVIATHCARATGSVKREVLWDAAVRLRTSTLYGAFGIDPVSGAQRAHRTVLTRWNEAGLHLA